MRELLDYLTIALGPWLGLWAGWCLGTGRLLIGVGLFIAILAVLATRLSLALHEHGRTTRKIPGL